MTGAQAVVQSLKDQGVDLIFGYPGGAIMPTYDAIFDAGDDLHHVLVRHEQGAAHAAVGYARATGKTGACVATSGPGATNLITGIADARIDHAPIVCITGQVFSHLLGTDAFQEADVVGMTVPATKWNYQITDASEVPYIIQKAFEIAASGNPGPVLIDITKDAQSGKMTYYRPESDPKARWKQIPLPSFQQILDASNIINEAQKPLLLVGHGVMLSQAESQVKALAEKANIPVASTYLGLSAFPCDHPLYKGMLGMHGNYAPNILSNQADVVIAVGMRFDDRVTGKVSDYLNDAKVIHIEIDQSELSKIVTPTVGILADARQALDQLLPYIKETQHDRWHEEFDVHYKMEKDQVIQDEIHPESGDLKMAEVIQRLSDKTNGEATLVTDVGQHQMVAARYYQFKHSNAHIGSGGLGTMGFALPAAIGAKMGQMNQQVIAIAGDGGIQMNIQELAVLIQEGVPLKILVLNNQFLGMVRQWQQLFFDSRYSFTKIWHPEFVTLAHAYGIQASSVSERSCLDDQLDMFLNSNQPYLLEVVVEKQENVFPMVPAGASISDTKLSAGGV